MSRYSLICRFGPDDTAPITVVQNDSEVVELDFLNADRRFDFGLGRALERLRSFGLHPSEAAFDLAVLAVLINAGDTRVARSANAQDGWAREIDLYVPVLDTALWESSAKLIGETLRFLTGDRWRLFFRPRPARFASVVPVPKQLALDGFTEVCLFSGGLDSLIGVIDLFAAGRRPLLVSHYWDSETAKAQTYLLERLRRRFPNPEIGSLRVRIGFDKNHFNSGAVEETQRGRSFLFFALASLAADAFQRPTRIAVPENGLIALNVPLDPLRFGALSTRTAHPYFLARMNDLFDRLGLRGRLENPYRHRTKGEMVAACADRPFLQGEAQHSMSCSSPGKARYKGLSPRHCGYCVPCLIRRASLAAGLGVADNTPYTVSDLSAQPLDTSAAEGEHVRSFQLMVSRIRARPTLASILVHKPGPLTDAPAEVPLYADVFMRGVMEVARILDNVVARPL